LPPLARYSPSAETREVVGIGGGPGGEASLAGFRVSPNFPIPQRVWGLCTRTLGSRLYFNKLAASYCQLEEQWPKEPLVSALEEVFQPW